MQQAEDAVAILQDRVQHRVRNTILACFQSLGGGHVATDEAQRQRNTRLDLRPMLARICTCALRAGRDPEKIEILGIVQTMLGGDQVSEAGTRSPPNSAHGHLNHDENETPSDLKTTTQYVMTRQQQNTTSNDNSLHYTTTPRCSSKGSRSRALYVFISCCTCKRLLSHVFCSRRLKMVDDCPPDRAVLFVGMREGWAKGGGGVGAGRRPSPLRHKTCRHDADHKTEKLHAIYVAHL